MKIKFVITTTDSNKTANVLAKRLVKDNLSPCVQITPNFKSVYKWEGRLEISGEVQLIIKTIPKNIQICKNLILKYHNYDVPEIVVTDGEILNDAFRDLFIQNSQDI